MRRFGLTAAFLVLVVAGCGPKAVSHSCGFNDKRFIYTASTNMEVLAIWAGEYREGRVDADELVAEAFGAAERVRRVSPSDPSLKLAQKLINGMFSEYGTAVELHAKGEESGGNMYRAYGLANFAHDVLSEAEPALAEQGCDVTSLL